MLFWQISVKYDIFFFTISGNSESCCSIDASSIWIYVVNVLGTWRNVNSNIRENSLEYISLFFLIVSPKESSFIMNEIFPVSYCSSSTASGGEQSASWTPSWSFPRLLRSSPALKVLRGTILKRIFEVHVSERVRNIYKKRLYFKIAKLFKKCIAPPFNKIQMW